MNLAELGSVDAEDLDLLAGLRHFRGAHMARRELVRVRVEPLHILALLRNGLLLRLTLGIVLLDVGHLLGKPRLCLDGSLRAMDL
eukprot:4077350-Pyramimonas_sp.AAC.1